MNRVIFDIPRNQRGYVWTESNWKELLEDVVFSCRKDVAPHFIGSIVLESKGKRIDSKKAYPWDNACIESFHSLIKREWLNRFKIRDYNHAYRLIFEYLEAFYNTKRIHSHCDYMSPNDYEELYRRLQQDELQLAG